MKKGNNSGNDDFSFSTGGDDEFFPLDLEKSSSKDTKAPKGVKGYLKNVAKSVVNLGVKTGKHMYPAAVELGEKFKPDTTSTTDPKATIANWKAEGKKYAGIGKDIIGSTIKDAKEAVKTGKFVKTEEEKNNAEEMFGDMFGDDGFDFGGDSVSYDVGGYDSDLGLGTDDEGGSVGATVDVGSAVVKSSYANARLNASLSEKTNATIVGASQTQIKSDREMFSQNLEISQEQHRQKMLMMTNIATNVGKIIEQGNVSIKAQMEFSAKQLAFSQDLAAMVKEVRDAQWKQVKSKETKQAAKSKFNKIFGDGKASGFNLGEFKKNFLTNMKSEAGGGAFDMLGTGKEMIDMMMDMGGGAGALKSMLGDMMFEAAVDKITSKRTRDGKDLLNRKLEGLPGAFNRKLNTISNEGAPELEKLIRRIPFFGNKLIDSGMIDIKKLAGYAHVDTDVKVKSGRFDMDPSEVHPFDNAAHKALTEVIPWQLAKIDAGINRTEQEFFNYKANKWEKVSSAKKHIDSARNEVLEYSEGYSTLSDRINAGMDLKDAFRSVEKEYATNSLFKNGRREKNWNKEKISSAAALKQEATDYIITNQKKIMHNIMMLGADYTMDDILSSMLDDSSELFPSLFIGLPNTDIDDNVLGLYLFNTIREFQESSPEDWIKFLTDVTNYKNRLTSANFESEEKYFSAGAGIVYDSTIESEIYDTSRAELNKKRKKLEDERAALLAGSESKIGKGLSSVFGKKASNADRLDKIKKELADLDASEKELTAAESDSTTGIVNIHKPIETDKFIISDLQDSSTHGLINNIYNLLLTGLDVYVKPNKGGKQAEYHNDILNHTLGLNGNSSIKEESFKAAKNAEAAKKDNVAYIKLSGPNDSKANNHVIYKLDSGTMKYVKYKDLTQKDSDGNPKTSLTQADFDNNELFIKYSDLKRTSSVDVQSVSEALKAREDSYENDEKAFNETWLSKIPGMKTLYKVFNGTTQKINDFGNKFLGENFYSEHDGVTKIDENSKYFNEIMTEEEREEYKKLKKKFEEAPGEFKEKAKTELNKFVNTVKNSKGVKSIKFGANIVKSAFNRSDLSSVTRVLGSKLAKITVKGKTLKEYVTEARSSELMTKLSQATSVGEQIQIVRDLGTSKSKAFADEMQKQYNEHKSKFDEAFNDRKNMASSISDVFNNVKNKVVDTIKNKIGLRLATMNQNRILSRDLINLKTKSGKTIGEIVAEINNPELLSNLNSVKTPDEKVDILLNYDHPLLNACKQELMDFKSSIADRDKSFGGVIAWTKARGKKALDKFIKNRLVKKLNKLKVGDKTLGEVLAEISSSDPSFRDKIESFQTMTDLAEFLLQSDNPKIAPFKKGIRELKEKHMDDEAQGGIAGIVGMGLVSGFDVIKKSMDAVKKLFDKRKKDAKSEIDVIEKYVHPDIVKLFGGVEPTMQIINQLTIDVEEEFKDNDMHKASEQIGLILDVDRKAKILNGKQKKALKHLKRYELEKESANSTVKSIKSRISGINESYAKEYELSGGDNMSSEDKKRLAAMRDEDLEHENKRLKKAEDKRDKAHKKIHKTLGDEDSVEGNSAAEQREAKAKAKEDKEKAKESKARLGFLATIANALTGLKKGVKLDKETTEDMKEAVAEGAAEGSEKGSGEGWSGKITSFMDKTGLSKTKLGKGVRDFVNKGGKASKTLAGNSKVASFLGKSKFGSKVLNIAGKFGGVASAGGGAAASAASAGGTVAAAGSGAAAAGGGASKGLVKILEKLFKSPKIAAKLGKSGAKTIIESFKQGIKKVLTKIFPKLATLNGMATNWIGWAALAATAIVSFTKGLANAKSTFNIGRGMRPTAGMRLACGLAAMLDGVLLGIPGIICKAMGFKNAEEWFYTLVGKASEKEALERYHRYNKFRAVVFGIDEPDKLVEYENRNLEKGGNFFDNLGSGIKRAGRAIGNVLSFGMMKNNDEKDSSLLGFQSVDIFKMWKDEKYTPLTTECVTQAMNELRSKHPDDATLSGMDDKKLKKYLEQTNAVSREDIDNNGDGEVDENAKAQAEAAALEFQNEYRKIYLEICRKYVLSKGLAWLNSHCTLEKFKKHTGKEAKADLTKGERAKRALGAIVNPIGTLITNKLTKKGAITAKEAKSIAVTAMLGPVALVAKGVKKLWKERKHIAKAVGNFFKRGVTKKLFLDPYNAFDKTKKMKAYKSSKKARRKFIDKLIDIAEKYGESHPEEWKAFNEKLMALSPSNDPSIGTQMADIFCKCASFHYVDPATGEPVNMVKATLGVDLDLSHLDDDAQHKISSASGMVGWVMEYMSEIDGMCQSISGMTVKRLAVTMIVNGQKIAKSESNYEKYVTRRAEIFGLKEKELKNFESGLKGGEKTTGFGKFKAGFKAMFSFGSDQDDRDAKRAGFKTTEIYKYWKQHKYDPLINIEKHIASKYGKYPDITTKTCEDVEAQNKFIADFIKEGSKFVNDNHLAWLTSDTTEEQFNEFKQNGFQSNATLASVRADRKKALQEEIDRAKPGSRKQKKLQAELNKINSANSGTMSSSNNIDLNKDFDKLTADLLKNYDAAGLKAHETASEAIKGIWDSIGGDFYGDSSMPEANNGSPLGPENGGPAEAFGAIGSNEKIRILKEKAAGTIKHVASNAYSSVKDKAIETANNTISKAKDLSNQAMAAANKYAPGLTDKVAATAESLKSPINDFVHKFKDELIHKLNILDEIHSEQLRHNSVSEDFYASVLNIMALMAKNQGNTKMASQLDSMVKQVAK